MKLLKITEAQVVELDKVRDKLIYLTKTYMELSNNLNNNKNNENNN